MSRTWMHRAIGAGLLAAGTLADRRLSARLFTGDSIAGTRDIVAVHLIQAALLAAGLILVLWPAFPQRLTRFLLGLADGLDNRLGRRLALHRLAQVSFPWKAVMVLSVALAAIRFLQITADAPAGITWSICLYTDEGWGIHNAVEYCRNGRWYVPGDFNYAILLPGLSLVETAAFTLFGTGLAVARTTAVALFVTLAIALYYLVRAYGGRRAAALAVLMLCANFRLFAYSRTLLLDVPMTCFAVLALLCAAYTDRRGGLLLAGASALFVVASVLTKLPGLFALPLAVFLIWMKDTPRLRRLACLGVAAAVLAACLTIHHFAIVVPYQAEFNRLLTYGTTHSQIPMTVPSLALSFVKKLAHASCVDVILWPLAVVSTGIGLLLSSHCRSNRLFVCCVLWVIGFSAMFCTKGYTPDRYLLPLAVPTVILVAFAFDRLLAERKTSVVTVLFGAVILASLAVSTVRIGQYLLHPRYTLVDTIRDIRKYCDSHPEHNKMVLGGMANMITLETALPSVNYFCINSDLADHLRRNRPGYFVDLGEIPSHIRAALGADCNVELIRTYDVMDNYTGEPVYFYRLTPARPANAAQSSADHCARQRSTNTLWGKGEAG